MYSPHLTLNDRLDPMAAVEARARKYVDKSLSDATQRALRSDWRQFANWCEEWRLCSMPAAVETIVFWLSEMAEKYRSSTLARKIASISKTHEFAGHESPTRAPIVRAALKGIRRDKRERGELVTPQTKAPILARHLREMVEVIPSTLTGTRDKAILLIGYAGGFRRSELSNLVTGDLEFQPEGVLIRLRHSKTNQDGSRAEMKDIGYGTRQTTCPVRALEAWLDGAGIASGPIFRPMTKHGTPRHRRLSGGAIAAIVKRHAARIGLDATKIAAHSLRAGFVTDQIDIGTPAPVIMRMTGHRSEHALNGYYRKAKYFERNLTATVGL